MTKNDNVSYKRLVMDDSYQTVSEWLADKNEDVHNMLLDAAVTAFAKKSNWISSLDDWEVIEHRRKSFLDVPSCTLRRKKWPFDTHIIDISEYWDTSFFNYSSASPTVIVNDNPIYDEEIVDVNYVTGKAKSASRLENVTKEIELSSITSDAKIATKEIEDTFTYKYDNKLK